MSTESQANGETPDVESTKTDDVVVDAASADGDGTRNDDAPDRGDGQPLSEPGGEAPATSGEESSPAASEDVTGVEASEVNVSESSAPEAEAPEAESPEAESPEAEAPEAESPEAEAPEAEKAKPKPKPRKRAKADADEDPNMDVEPLELVEEEAGGTAAEKHWYILKVQVNREGTIRDALERRVKIEGLEDYVDEIIVPTEDIAEFTKNGKRKITKRKLYPGYIMVNMVINDDTWFAVRETPGIGDFTGSAGKPTPMDPHEVERILRRDVDDDEETQVKTSIPFTVGDHVRVKEGNFQNFEGDVDKIDEAHGLITVVINIFNRATPVEIQYWQIEKV